MAATCQYSRDAIDSIMSAEDDETPWRTSNSEPPSASDRLTLPLEEAMLGISQMLQGSADVMEKFRSEWDAALTSYQLDIGVMDEEIERMAKEQKRRKKKVAVDAADDGDDTTWGKHAKSQGPEADHALNFHLRSSNDESNYNDGSDIFLLPTDEIAMEITELSDEQNEAAKESNSTGSNDRVNDSNGESKQTTSTKNVEKSRFDSALSVREDLLNKMQSFREEEANLEAQLSAAQPQDNGMSSLTIQERSDLEDTLEQCRARQTRQVVASVSSYKPRFKSSSKSSKLGSSSTGKLKSSDLGLRLPSIEDILEDAMTDAVPIGRKEFKAGPKAYNSRNKSTKQKKKGHKQQGNLGDRAAMPASTPLTLNYRDVSGTEQHVMQDPDNFLTVHEQRPEPSARSLSALVKCNTRPLNAMELGRRKRIDKK